MRKEKVPRTHVLKMLQKIPIKQIPRIPQQKVWGAPKMPPSQTPRLI